MSVAEVAYIVRLVLKYAEKGPGSHSILSNGKFDITAGVTEWPDIHVTEKPRVNTKKNVQLNESLQVIMFFVYIQEMKSNDMKLKFCFLRHQRDFAAFGNLLLLFYWPGSRI